MTGCILCFFAVCVFHFHDFVGQNFSVSCNDFNIVFLKQKLNTLAHIFSYSTTTSHHSGKIRFYFSIYSNAIVCSMLQITENLCRFHQGFCWNTTPIQAYSSQFSTFYNSGFHSQLSGFYGSNITTRTASDYYYIKICHLFIKKYFCKCT